MTIEEFKEKLAEYVGTDETERGIDLLDAFGELETNLSDFNADEKVKEVEEKWKKRYIERFKEPVEVKKEETKEETKEEKINDLFE